MIPVKQKVQLRTKAFMDKVKATASEEAVAELFAEVDPPRVTPPRLLRSCVVCEARDVAPAHADERHVCAGCAADPQAAARRLAGLRTMVLNHQRQSGERYAASVAALDESEAARWAVFGDLWILDRAGMASEDEARKVAATLAAYKHPAHPRVSDALRAVYDAWEAMYYADEGSIAETKKLDARLAHLGVCLEELGRKDEADALYRKDATL